MSNEERKEQLLKNIENWEKELNEVWRDTNTDAAEVERRNLRNLIYNARREIDEIDGVVQENLDEIDPEELLNNLKNEKENEEVSKNRLKLSIERLKEEREDYKGNKDLYDEYTKKINETEKELEELENKEKSREEIDKKLRILTKGRMQQETEKRRIESEIRRKLQEISEIQYDTEQAMEEVTLSSGEKTNQPKVLRLYNELDKLRATLQQKDTKINEYQDVIDDIKGIDKSDRQTQDLSPEEIRYFHGQGDLREYGGENGEDTRNNRLANDEYFGLRGGRNNGVTPTVPTQTTPNPTPTIPDPTPTIPDPTPTIPGPTPSQPTTGVEIEKSGLQIFREQFNQMPEIKNKHTLSERFDIVMPMGMPAAAALSAFVNPFLGIPVLAGTVAAKPIIYRVTGQKKLEDEIRDQFLDMDEGEFNKMVDYLSEERQSELKPNAVILNALHKAMLVKTKETKERLDNELDDLQSERDQILEKGENITEQEKQRLQKINSRIVSICDYTTDSDGKRGPSESEIAARRLKEVRRGKDRISARYKGNIGSKFLNIFNHRNSTTEEYYDPINEYADAEKARDIATVTGDHVKAAEEQKNMEQVLQDNTFTNGRGVQKSVFNAKKGAVKVISDARDRTVQFVATILTAGIGLTKFGIDKANADKIQTANQQKYAQLQNQHNSDVNNIQQATGRINQNEVQSVADGQVTEIGTAREHAVLNKHGDFTAQYHTDDLQTQKIVQNATNNSKITGNTAGDQLHRLSQVIKGKIPAATDLANSVSNPAMSGSTLNAHSTLLGHEQNYVNQVTSEANLVDKCADVLDIAEKMQISSGQLGNSSVSWTGPIIAAVSGFIGRIRSAHKDRNTIKENQEIEQEL